MAVPWKGTEAVNTWEFVIALGIMIAGTYGVRLLGVRIGQRQADKADFMTGPSPVTVWFERAVVVLILGLAVANTFYQGTEFAGSARLCGVLVGVGIALLRAPMLVAVLVAMAVTAVLRIFGLG